jgi:hypothetical protein
MLLIYLLLLYSTAVQRHQVGHIFVLGIPKLDTDLLVLLFWSYQGFSFMKQSSGSTYRRTSKLYAVGGKGLVLYKYR